MSRGSSFPAWRKNILDVPVIVQLLSPPVRKVPDKPGLRYRTQRRQSFCQYYPLLTRMEGLTQRVTERPVQKDRAWRLYPEGILADDRNADRRNALALDLSLDQPYGLITDPSTGRQQSDVHGIFFQKASDVRRCSAHEGQDMTLRYMAHKAVCPFRQAADDALSDKFPQPLIRKDYVNVAVGICVVVIIVGDRETIELTAQIDNAEGRIAVPVKHIEGRLIAVMHASGRNQCEFALRQRLRHGSPGDIFRFPWCIGFNEPRCQGWIPRYDPCD